MNTKERIYFYGKRHDWTYKQLKREQPVWFSDLAYEINRKITRFSPKTIDSWARCYRRYS